MNNDKSTNIQQSVNQNCLKDFFGNGIFDWQLNSRDYKRMWDERCYNEDKYWGGFLKEKIDRNDYKFPDWAIGPFKKHIGNPAFSPSENGWDREHFGGGVHNGSILRKDEKFFYIYRGEQDLPPTGFNEYDNVPFDYICDIGIAYSEDGINFIRDTEHSPLFRTGEDSKYSFEDVNVVKHEDTYYLFCNRWDWLRPTDPSVSGVFLATSKDLLVWEKKGLVFPAAKSIHRNPCVVQNPNNEAVRVRGKFVMYLNGGIIAYSDDLITWKDYEINELWPGGEGCFALADYKDSHPDNIILFTGGHHTGHFYAIGEVLFSKANPQEAVEWLPVPVIHAEPQYPWENGLSAIEPYTPVSYWRDTIFFTGMTKHDEKWWMYYGGSEYYTCLATSEK
jgi:predicted GH43/DUF377 family glycosyl hydrolase